MSVFYDHLVGLDELHSELADFELPFKDHYELLNQADSILHNEILNVILIILSVLVINFVSKTSTTSFFPNLLLRLE